MITDEKYTVLDIPCSNLNLSGIRLCIINFNIINNMDYAKRVIIQNPTTVFWASTNDFSREYVLCASKLGITNLIHLPVKVEQIENFFTEPKTDKEKYNNYLPLSNSKVLIVDDNQQNRTLLEDILSELGVSVTSCMTPGEVISFLEKEKFDLFILDILMPEMSGFELAEIINNTNLNKGAKIIFISAISGNKNIMNGYNLGAFSYIEKAYCPSIVKAQIYNILKSVEAEKTHVKEKENFVAALTHDLKSPINAEILALQQLIKKPEQSKEMLSELLNSAKYMRHITDKILSHYKQEKNGVTLYKEKVSINSLILSSIEEIRYLSNEKGINIRYRNSVGMADLFVDKIEIKRVIINLLSNAIEYSHSNSYIDIILNKSAKNYIVTIKDYGIGIDLKNCERIFDEYITLSKQYNKVGFGLGLKISKAIITAHNGKIKLESKPNKGTSVKISLPVNYPSK